jgi:hypothetical protein
MSQERIRWRERMRGVRKGREREEKKITEKETNKGEERK